MAGAWTLAEIEELNPGDGQPGGAGFLQRLLELGATYESLLCEFASLLEDRGGPNVVAFGQLPFDLGLGPCVFEAPSDRPGVSVELHVRPVSVSFDMIARLTPSPHEGSPSSDETLATQLAGVVRLPNPRAQIHRLYVSRLDNLQYLGEPLGDQKVQAWMRIPETSLDQPHRRQRPLTGYDFQSDLARRARSYLLHATKVLLGAYSIAALTDVRARHWLFGYHAMIAPGRLVGADAPTPLLTGLVSRASCPPALLTGMGDLQDTINMGIRGNDVYIRRLQALHTLCRDGEPELALVGICTNLEWFLNKRFPQLATIRKNGDTHLGSISAFLKKDFSTVLTTARREQLRALVEARNSFVHGAPPASRTQSALNEGVSLVRNALLVALETYRDINLSSRSESSR
jgi:hypothetical protein